MIGIATLYGREGLKAVGDPQVAELLKRTVTSQYQATRAFDALVAGLKTAGTTPWTAPVPSMAVAHKRWLSSALWQLATSYLDGVVEVHSHEAEIPRATYKQCDALCDLAGAMTMQAIKLQSEMDTGVRPTNAELVYLPSFDLTGPGYTGVWRICEAVYMLVQNDFRAIEELGVDRRMQAVHQVVKSALKPKVDVFSFLRTSWSTTATRDNQLEIIHNALPLTQELFALGQQLWVPYLLGPVYVEALRYKPNPEELGISDPWALTDPLLKREYVGDKAKLEELKKFWRSLADPAAALALSQQVQDALKHRRIRLRYGQGYKTVPWPAQYLVRSPVTFGTRSFTTGDLVAFYVNQVSDSKAELEVRRTGRVTSILGLLGQ